MFQAVSGLGDGMIKDLQAAQVQLRRLSSCWTPKKVRMPARCCRSCRALPALGESSKRFCRNPRHVCLVGLAGVPVDTSIQTMWMPYFCQRTPTLWLRGKKAGMDILLFAMQHKNRSRDFKLNIVEMYVHEVVAGYSQSHPPSFVGWLDPWGLWLSVECGGWHVGQAECEVRGRESGFRESWSREEDIASASDDQPQESKDRCQWRGLR